MLSLKHASVQRLNAFDAYLQRQIIGLSNTKHTEQILMIKSTGWIEKKFHLRHVRVMSGMSGDAESSCDIPWAVIAFPLVGESDAPLSSQTEDVQGVPKNTTQSFKSS